MSQVWQNWRHKRNHRTEQNCAGKHFRPEEQNCRRNVRAIRITDRGNAFRIEFITRRRHANKIGQFLRTPDDIFLIEDAFSQTAEEARHAVLENVSAWTEQRRGWIEVASERNHVV